MIYICHKNFSLAACVSFLPHSFPLQKIGKAFNSADLTVLAQYNFHSVLWKAAQRVLNDKYKISDVPNTKRDTARICVHMAG